MVQEDWNDDEQYMVIIPIEIDWNGRNGEISKPDWKFIWFNFPFLHCILINEFGFLWIWKKIDFGHKLLLLSN